MRTRNGIYYDLAKSNYKYSDNGLTFVFSSRLHLDKFTRKVKENRQRINLSLTKRFNIDIDVSTLADIILYKKVETRGFLIVCNEGFELWEKEHITFAGGTVTKRNCNGQ